MKYLRHISILVLVLGAILSSCSGTKNLTRPQLDLPQAIAGMEPDSLSLADMRWWEFYTDSTLKYIINETLEHNRDFLAAAARVDELRELYGVDKLAYLPVINGSAYANRETNHYAGEAFKSDPEVGIKASLSWEADLWGGVSAARRRSAATYRASVEDMRAMQMTLIAEAATAYFNLAALRSELSIVRRTLTTRHEALEKARLRFEGGLTSELVYQQAKVEYATTAALIPSLERRIELASSAITLLMGRFPGDKFASLPLDLDVRLDSIMPIGVPSELMTRRPDIKASEERLRAALENCGVAYSNRFPSVSIGLSGGVENDGFAKIFQAPFTYMVGSIAGTIFDFGRKKRKYKASIAAYEQARYAYEQKVMEAFTEVNDAVITYRAAGATASSRRELRDAALKYVTLANRQYMGGSLNYIDVLDAQRRYFDAQIAFSNAVRDQYLALAALYKALGGGW